MGCVLSGARRQQYQFLCDPRVLLLALGENYMIVKGIKMTAQATHRLAPEVLRKIIYQSFYDRGSAPAIAELASECNETQAQIAGALRWLHREHHIVLQDDGEILAAHPFSNVPMAFEVRFKETDARGFCIWDALGIAAMVCSNATIRTRCAYCLKGMSMRVTDEHLEAPSEGVAQYLVPAQEMWHDVCFTCANQLAFCNVQHADLWRDAYHQKPGSILSLEQSWHLAREWYGEDRRDPSWRRRTVAEANAVFSRVGLEAPFWRLETPT